MKDFGFASRYGEAYLDIISDDLSAKILELERFGELFEDISLCSFFATPAIRKEEKILRIDTLKKKGLISDELSRFIKVILSRNRGFALQRIIQETVSLSNKLMGVKIAKVFTAFELDNQTTKKLKASLEKRYKTTVKLDIILDKSLIGGLKVFIDDELIDGSLKAKNEYMRERLKKGDASGY